MRDPENAFIEHRMEMARHKALADLGKAEEAIGELPGPLLHKILSLPEHIAIAALHSAIKGPQQFPHLTPASHIVRTNRELVKSA